MITICASNFKLFREFKMLCGQKLDQMNVQVFKCACEIEVIHGDDVIWYLKSLIGTLNGAFCTRLC